MSLATPQNTSLVFACCFTSPFCQNLNKRTALSVGDCVLDHWVEPIKLSNRSYRDDVGPVVSVGPNNLAHIIDLPLPKHSELAVVKNNESHFTPFQKRLTFDRSCGWGVLYTE